MDGDCPQEILNKKSHIWTKASRKADWTNGSIANKFLVQYIRSKRNLMKAQPVRKETGPRHQMSTLNLRERENQPTSSRLGANLYSGDRSLVW